jgi:ribose transport system substrate-binding protein
MVLGVGGCQPAAETTATETAAAETTAATAAETTAAEPEKKEFIFAIVPKVVHPWFDEVKEGAEDYAEFLGEQVGAKISINYVAPSTAEVTAQNAILEQVAATRPAGITVDPLDAVGNKQVIDEIRQQGINFILFDATPYEDLPSVYSGNRTQALLAVKHLVEILDGKGKVAIMQGFPTAPNHKERYDTYIEYLADYPDITVVDGGIDNDDIETAQQQGAAVLAANPDLNGYLTCDAAGPVGLGQAIKEAGKKGQVLAIGIAELPEILTHVKEGNLESTIATLPRVQGAYVVNLLWHLNMGQKIPYSVDVGTELIDQSNVDEYLK